MAKAKKVKKKTKSVRFYGLNITLQSTHRKGSKTYLQLIKKIYEEQLAYTVGKEIVMLLRNQFTTTFNYQNKKRTVLYGKLLRFNSIKNWYNKKDQMYLNHELPENLVPNAFDTDYVFIPDAHKFLIRYNNRANVYQVKTFLEKALKEVTVVGELVHVSIMTSNDVIETIMESKSIINLTVSVSYTNDEISKDAKEVIDKLLKGAHSGQAEVNFKPDATGTLDAKSTLVSGFLGVAKDNGHADATILNDSGRRTTIHTANYPEKINVTVTETAEKKEDENEVLFNKIMKDYKKDGKD
jgi:hypothetical protein